MLIQGWGRFPKADIQYREIQNRASAFSLLEQYLDQGRVIPRGSGRSYGDSAIASHVLSTRYLDSFISFDSVSGELICESGVSLSEILELTIPKGWIPAVLPGTKFPTVGGAISSDIHGKNHHLDGCFSEHVREFDLLLADGRVATCSRESNADLFFATCGGMGLTGFILTVTLQLRKISSAEINEQLVVANNLEEILQLFDTHQKSTYSVAWLDCMAKGDSLGRSILFLGEHCEDGELSLNSSFKVTVPFSSPAFLLNKFSMSAFNALYFRLKSSGKKQNRVHYDSYFFPLDRINHWNRLYGSRGFLQYQFVLPSESAHQGIRLVLDEIVAAGKGSFLSVLKQFGAANKNMLSFPLEGYTLALDFKYEASLMPILDRLDEIVIDHGGRLYLTKDSRMNETVFKKGYPNWEAFKRVKEEYDPEGVFSSLQSQRLGL